MPLTTHYRLPVARKGFTLIELLIAVGIATVILALGLFFNGRSYERGVADSERDTVVGLIAKARSEAMENLDQANHGFYAASSTYVVFEGVSYASRTAALDETFPRSSRVTLGGITEIVFRASDGAALATGTLTIATGIKSLSVTVNQEGMIDW